MKSKGNKEEEEEQEEQEEQEEEEQEEQDDQDQEQEEQEEQEEGSPETKDNKDDDKIGVSQELVADYKEYDELKAQFDALIEATQKSISRHPLESIDSSLVEGLVVAMNEALVYRPDNLPQFISNTLSEYSKGGEGVKTNADLEPNREIKKKSEIEYRQKNSEKSVKDD